VLGHHNSASGELSQIAKDRCQTAFHCWQQNPTAKVLCSGGFGEFNQTNVSHADWQKRYLTKQGLPDAHFLPSALSRFTFDDATCSKAVLNGVKVVKLYLVTSDFHMPRASMIFTHLFANTEIVECCAKHNLGDAERASLVAHEQVATVRDRACLVSDEAF